MTTTANVPIGAKLQERLATPDPVTLDGVTVQAVLFVDRPTTPANPFKPETVMADVPDEPALTITEDGLAETEKSWTMKVTVAAWERDPLVPVMLTWFVLGEAKLQDRLADPEPATLVGLVEQDVLFVPRLTTPVKPFSPVTVIIELPDAPALTVMLGGLAAMVKSWTV